MLRLDTGRRITNIQPLDENFPPHISARQKNLFDVLTLHEDRTQLIIQLDVMFCDDPSLWKKALYAGTKGYLENEKFAAVDRVVYFSITQSVMPKYRLQIDQHAVNCLDRSVYHYPFESDINAELANRFSFLFVELDHFEQVSEYLQADEKAWGRFLKFQDNCVTNSAIQQAYELLHSAKWTDLEIAQYENCIMRISDHCALVNN